MGIVKSVVVVIVIVTCVIGYYVKTLGRKGIYLNFIIPYATKIICSRWFRNLQFNTYRYINSLHGGNDRTLTYYHDVYDPHSIAMLYVLPLIIKHYSVQIIPKLVSNASIKTFGGTQCKKFNIADASIQCQYYKVPIPLPLSHDHMDEGNDAIRQKLYQLSNGILAQYVDGDVLEFVDCALAIAYILWDSNASLQQKHGLLLSKYECNKHKLSGTQTEQILTECHDELTKRKHYLSGNIYFNCEWFPRMDRLFFLFQRLQSYKIGNIYNEEIAFKNPLILPHVLSFKNWKSKTLNLYFSFRSPYSYLVLERATRICDKNDLKLNIKPVLPSIFRKVNINPHKGMYILWDCARCAEFLGIPFGSVFDVGLDLNLIELCLKLFLYAKSKGKERQFTLEIAKCIWCKGKNISKEETIRKIFTKCGALNYDEYRNEYQIKYLNANQHLKMAETNLNDLYSTGNWGVPTMQLDDRSVWGQDRLWALFPQYVNQFPKSLQLTL
eukprot:140521_1